jgi:hypothetical protein
MRGKLKVPGDGVFLSKGAPAVQSLPISADEGGAAASQVRLVAPWLVGVLIVLTAGSALPQGSLDAGKTPAQMFADTCSNCHRRPQELKRASAGFLRQHYTPGAQEAAAMASYLAAVPADPRAGAGKEKAKPLEKAQEKEKAKAQVQAQDRPNDRPPMQQERPKAPPVVVKGKRPEVARSTAPEAPVEVPQESRAEAPVIVPKLEPFEE